MADINTLLDNDRFNSTCGTAYAIDDPGGLQIRRDAIEEGERQIEMFLLDRNNHPLPAVIQSDGSLIINGRAIFTGPISFAGDFKYRDDSYKAQSITEDRIANNIIGDDPIRLVTRHRFQLLDPTPTEAIKKVGTIECVVGIPIELWNKIVDQQFIVGMLMTAHHYIYKKQQSVDLAEEAFQNSKLTRK